MKSGAVVPDVVRVGRQFAIQNICGDPLDSGGGRTETLLGNIDRGLGDVEHGEISVAGGQQVVDQGRCAAADIDDGSVVLWRGLNDQPERSFQVESIPADRLRRLAAINLIPVMTCTHGAVGLLARMRGFAARVERRQSFLGVGADDEVAGEVGPENSSGRID